MVFDRPDTRCRRNPESQVDFAGIHLVLINSYDDKYNLFLNLSSFVCDASLGELTDCRQKIRNKPLNISELIYGQKKACLKWYFVIYLCMFFDF